MSKQILEKANKALEQLVQEKKMKHVDSVDQRVKDVFSPFLQQLIRVQEAGYNKVVDAVKQIKVDVPQNIQVAPPQVNVPDVNVPPIQIPDIKVPEPKVTVNVDPITPPAVNIPPFNFPEMMKVYGGVELEGITHSKPLPVVDVSSKPSTPRIVRISGGDKLVHTDDDGHLQVAEAHSGLAIAEGSVQGHTFVHKFGNAPDFDTGDNEVTIWDGANDALLGGGAMSYTYSSSADIGLLSSSNAGDSQDIEIQGLDTDGNLLTQTFTLNGQTDVDLSSTGSDYKRVFRMKNVGSTDIAGVVYLRINGSAQSGGVPTVANTVRAIINGSNNQTLMALYTIPKGRTGYMRSFFAAEAGGKKSTNYIIKVKAKPKGQVFQVKHKTAVSSGATSSFQHTYVEPEVFTSETDIEISAQITEASITAGDVAAGFDIVLVE